MAGGSNNDEAIMSDLLVLPCLVHIATVGPMARREDSYYADSRDGIAALDLSDISGSTDSRTDKKIADEGKILALVTVEIKTRFRSHLKARFCAAVQQKFMPDSGTRPSLLELYHRNICWKSCFNLHFLV